MQIIHILLTKNLVHTILTHIYYTAYAPLPLISIHSLTPTLTLFSDPYIDGYHGDGGDPEGRVLTVRGCD